VEVKAEHLDGLLSSLRDVVNEPAIERFDQRKKDWALQNPERARALLREKFQEDPEGLRQWVKEHPEEAAVLLDEPPQVALRDLLGED
jgi:hypothetical protein